MTRGVAVTPAETISAPSFGFHWLTFSCNFADLDRLPGGWSKSAQRGRFGRRFARLHESGASVFFDSDDELAVVDVPGEVCDTWSSDWITSAAQIGGKVTRLDVACDLEPASLARRRMLEMRRAFLSDRCETLVQRLEEHRSYAIGDGFTWYFGGRQSELRLRAYDRRGPLRLEWQWRPVDTARVLAGVVAHNGPASTWRTLAQKLIFPFPWYVHLLEGSTISIERVQREIPDYQRVALQHREQYGIILWALHLLGIPPHELERAPGEGIHHGTAAKLLRWAREAGDQGRELQDAVKHLTRS